MTNKTLTDKIAKHIIIYDKKHACISLAGIADIFNKDINIIEREMFKVIQNDELEKPVFLYVSHPVIGIVIDKILFGALTVNYNSKHAIVAKMRILDALLKAEEKLIEKKVTESMGLNELPQSKLEPILRGIFDKLMVIDDKLEAIGEILLKTKKKELSPEEKIYKAMRLEKIKEKVEFMTRNKAAQLMNEKIYKEKDHGLVYNMEHMIEKEKE